jgi:hypothetical protein
VQITKSKGSREAFESYDSKFVFFAKLLTSGIFKMPVEGGEETQVLQQGGLSLWALTDQGICFFDLSNPSGAILKFHNLASGKTTLLRQFPRETQIEKLRHCAKRFSRRPLGCLHRARPSWQRPDAGGKFSLRVHKSGGEIPL